MPDFPDDPNSKNEFEQLRDQHQLSLAREFLYFVVENKKWWLIPILLVLGLLGVLVALGSSGAAPFIYSFF